MDTVPWQFSNHGELLNCTQEQEMHFNPTLGNQQDSEWWRQGRECKMLEQQRQHNLTGSAGQRIQQA